MADVKFTKIKLSALANCHRYKLENPNYYVQDSSGNDHLFLEQLILIRDNLLKLINAKKVSSLDLANTLDVDIHDLHNVVVSMRNNYPQDLVSMLASYFSVDYFELLYSRTEKDYTKLNKKAKKLAESEHKDEIKKDKQNSKTKTKKKKDKIGKKSKNKEKSRNKERKKGKKIRKVKKGKKNTTK